MIIIDTREQSPYQFPGSGTIGFKEAALKWGDYSLEGGEKIIAIERKSFGDYVNSVSSGRLNRQLLKLSENVESPILMLDFSYSNMDKLYLELNQTIKRGITKKSGMRISSQALKAWVRNKIIDWPGKIIFAGSHLHGAELCYKILRDYNLKLNKRLKMSEKNGYMIGSAANIKGKQAENIIDENYNVYDVLPDTKTSESQVK